MAHTPPLHDDPRRRIAWRGLILAWTFFLVYLIAILLTSYLLSAMRPLWGLPGWVAIGNVVVPVIFVLALIPVVEKCIPDVPLSDDTDSKDAGQ